MLGRFLLNLTIFRWLKARIIFNQFDVTEWVFEQPSVQKIDELILEGEKDKALFIHHRQFAPDDYDWDYMRTPNPEPSPKWKFDISIRKIERAIKRLHQKLDRESLNLLGQLTFPPQFNRIS